MDITTLEYGRNLINDMKQNGKGINTFHTDVHLVVIAIGKRFSLGQPRQVKVYPSYLMLTRYELLAISNNLTELGIKKIRRVGNHTEFEQIRDYV